MKYMSDLWKMAAHWKGAPKALRYRSLSILRHLVHTMHYLASATVTELGVQRLLAVEFVGDLPTLALPAPFHRAELIVGLYEVRRTVLPLLDVDCLFGE